MTRNLQLILLFLSITACSVENNSTNPHAMATNQEKEDGFFLDPFKIETLTNKLVQVPIPVTVDLNSYLLSLPDTAKIDIPFDTRKYFIPDTILANKECTVQAVGSLIGEHAQGILYYIQDNGIGNSKNSGRSIVLVLYSPDGARLGCKTLAMEKGSSLKAKSQIHDLDYIVYIEINDMDCISISHSAYSVRRGKFSPITSENQNFCAPPSTYQRDSQAYIDSLQHAKK